MKVKGLSSIILITLLLIGCNSESSEETSDLSDSDELLCYKSLFSFKGQVSSIRPAGRSYHELGIINDNRPEGNIFHYRFSFPDDSPLNDKIIGLTREDSVEFSFRFLKNDPYTDKPNEKLIERLEEISFMGPSLTNAPVFYINAKNLNTIEN